LNSTESIEHKFGHNPAILNTATEDIWGQGGDLVYLTADTAHWISSSDNDDDEEITIIGQNNAGVEVTQTIDLTGQTPAPLATDMELIYRAFNSDSTVLEGDIYIFTTDTLTAGVPDTAADIKAKIQVGFGQTLMTHYRIPAGKTGFMESWEYSTDGSTEFHLQVRAPGGVFRIHDIVHTDTSGFVNYAHPLRLLAGTDIKVSAVGRANVDVAANINMLMLDD
jgi:hypothetical protein